ncbi:MAG: ATP-dependent Clp protease adaptor ClpS [Chitinophagales bacterium]|nr:ATP-dependent Clp protease adaptor ClpS [Chitinophagales bacterium]
MSNFFSNPDTRTDAVLDVVEELIDLKKLVVYNDDVNTFEHVIESLVDVCDHSEEQAEQCSYIIHYKGKASVREGMFEELYPMKTGLTDRGLNATIE